MKSDDKVPTASVYKLRSGWAAKITFRDGTRTSVALPGVTAKTAAKALAKEVQRKAWFERDAPPKPARKTVPAAHEPSRYIEAWIEERKAAGTKTADDDAWLLGKHLLPFIEHRASIVDVTAEDIENIRDALDAKVRAGTMAPKSAWNAWGKIKRLFDDLAHTKNRAMRLRTDDPTLGIRGPDDGDCKEGQILFPSEFVTIVSCEAVPLEWRRLIAMAVYLGKRAGELRAITVADVDLEHERIAVTKAWVRRSRSVGTPKTNTRKWVSLEPALVPLVRQLVSEAGEQKDAPLFWMCREKDQPVGLRHWAKVAGLTRHELFHDSPTTRMLNFHDLRRTCATWMAAQGKSSDAIRARTGHQHLATLERYIKDWRHDAHAFGEPFPALPEALLVYAPCLRKPGDGSKLAKSMRFSVEAPGIENDCMPPARANAGAQDHQHTAQSPDIDENQGAVDAPLDTDRRRVVAIAQGLAAMLRAGRYDDAATLARRLAGVLDRLAFWGGALVALGVARPGVLS